MIELESRVIAVGIPGIAGVRQVGSFHAGGAIPSNPQFAATTRHGALLDPEAVLVTSTSNFGAPLGVPSQATGAILSISSRGNVPWLIPSDFARRDGQAVALDGAVRLFTAQSPAFLNRINNARALTALEPAVSNPRYISINNAFGRPWFASVPQGADGPGTSTVLDPTGRPLANPPSTAAGGVFAGTETNRHQQEVPGALRRGAVGTAFLGPSPDASGFAVFAVVGTDGSVVQVHVRDGVDGLAPASTITPMRPAYPGNGGLEGAGLVGMAFNWLPNRILYVADSPKDAIVALHLQDDGRVFRLQVVQRYTPPGLAGPVDLAPAIPEVANPRFSSHTTLAGNADLYIANRGDGTLARLTQAGEVIAQARITVPGLGVLGSGRLNGIAIAEDAQRLWLTLSGELADYPGRDGVLIVVSAFDAQGPLQTRQGTVLASGATDERLAEKGQAAFMTEFGVEQGLGPLFNKRSCVACHHSPTPGGMGAHDSTMGIRVGYLDTSTGRFDPLVGRGGPVARVHSIQELGHTTRQQPGIPSIANVVSLRAAPSLYGLALIDQIPDAVILAQAVDKGDGIRGRPHMVTTHDGQRRVGKFGWKADIATLAETVAVALANELGITSPLARHAGRAVHYQSDDKQRPAVDDDGGLAATIEAYLVALRFPEPYKRSE